MHKGKQQVSSRLVSFADLLSALVRAEIAAQEARQAGDFASEARARAEVRRVGDQILYSIFSDPASTQASCDAGGRGWDGASRGGGSVRGECDLGDPFRDLDYR